MAAMCSRPLSSPRFWCMAVTWVSLLAPPVGGWALADEAKEERRAVREPGVAPTPLDLLHEVSRLVRDEFFDPELRDVDWGEVRLRHAAMLESRPGELSAVVNSMLAELATSHTRFYTVGDPAYYQLLAIFEPVLREPHAELYHRFFGDGPVRYPGIGIFTEEISGKTVVTGVLDGQPAAQAGLLRGDVILAVDDEPFRPVVSFIGKVGQPVAVTVERNRGEEPVEVVVIPRELVPATLFLDAMRSSARVESRDGGQVGYVHAWSYTGEAYQDLLEELVLLDGPLATADALVLDLRGGWGGASLGYLTLFHRDVPVLTMTHRDGEARTLDTQWRKPVVALVDGSTRSGKETLAFGFRRHAIGPVVGSRTAGAVAGGKPFLLSDGSLLFLAVAEVLVDGVRLEGRGVEPDVEVAPELLYARGRDPQRERALEVAAELHQTSRQADSGRPARTPRPIGFP